MDTTIRDAAVGVPDRMGRGDWTRVAGYSTAAAIAVMALNGSVFSAHAVAWFVAAAAMTAGWRWIYRDTIRAIKRRMNTHGWVPCHRCHGWGHVPNLRVPPGVQPREGDGWVLCPRCHGYSWVNAETQETAA